MRQILRASALLFAFHTVMVWGGTPAATVSLDDTVVVEHEQLRLGDIARVSGGEPWQLRLQQLGLGPAPRAGLSRRFNRESISALIRERYGRSLTIAWEGSNSLTVTRAANEYKADTFVEPARQYLLNHVRARRADLTRIEVTPVGSMKPLQFPHGKLSLTVRQIRGDALAKRVCVWVDTAVNGVPAGSLPIWFALSAYRPAVVAVRNISRHEKLNARDVRFEERDVAGLTAEPLASERELDVLRARLPLPEGRVLLATDVELAPSVLRNQEIQVQVVSGGVLIETSGIAMQEGRVGDRVAVRNPASQKSYLAQVISEGVVMVSAQ